MRNIFPALIAVAFLLFTVDAEARGGGGRSGGSRGYKSHGCTGVCYGHIGSTGKSRDTYVRGYMKSNGTYVQPYTRGR